jgi:hypothetical protein
VLEKYLERLHPRRAASLYLTILLTSSNMDAWLPAGGWFPEVVHITYMAHKIQDERRVGSWGTEE